MKEFEYGIVKEVEILGKCIFCDKPVTQSSIEHIVPESLGNKDYVLPVGTICKKCNNDFSRFEEKALSRTMLGFERARMGIPTKKGNAAIAKSGNLTWSGNKSFKKNIIDLNGITEEDIESYDEKTGSFKIKIKDFDKSEMSMSKLLLKIGFESLSVSQKKIFISNNFTDLKEHLTNKNNADWPFLTTTSLKLSKFHSIPRFTTKHQLNKIKTQLLISQLDSNTLIFSFKYSVASYMINLVSRDIAWAKDYIESSDLIHLYPEYLRKRII